ncbi:MAG: reverse transcriptase/maturase family protein [bacterium]
MKLCSFENLLLASRKARLGKRMNTDVARFEINLEHELVNLAKDLQDQSYRPGEYREFIISEPKKRMISAAPYRDRVLHHALCNVIEPIFERTFISDSYANRKGKGTHKAILRYLQFAQHNTYALKCDIQKFFPSIDHQLLKQNIRKKVACKKTIWLIDTVIDHSNRQEAVLNYYSGDSLFTPFERRKGLPIGNLTSQFFANVYLNPLDHFIKEVLQCKHYIRYVDDFVLFSEEKQQLQRWKEEIESWLESLRLTLHPKKTRVLPVNVGLSFLGHRVFPEFLLLNKDNVLRFKRRLKKMSAGLVSGNVTMEHHRSSIASWEGHAKFSNTYRLRKKIFRDGSESEPCVAGRFVEQQNEQPPDNESQQEHTRKPKQQ